MRDFWLSAPEGRLCAWELAKALAFREESRELPGGEVNLAWVAARVTKVGGGHPTRSAMCQFFAMVGLGAHLPRNVFTDRGTGMYTSSGKIVEKYRQAIDEAGLTVYWGPDARRQSPDMGDMLLHETAVAWLRRRMRAERPVCVPWEETRVQWAHRAKRVVDHINSHYDVAAPC